MHTVLYRLTLSLFLATISLGQITVAQAAEPADAQTPAAEIAWFDDYAKATLAAEQQGKMLLVLFREPGQDRLSERFESKVLRAESVSRRLNDWICVRLPRDASIRVAGQPTTLLDHAAFAALNHAPGIAILDFAHKDADYYGCVVTALPVSECQCYSARQMEIILDLPPGRPEQRAEAYAAQTHAEPATYNRPLPDTTADESPKVRWMSDYAKAMTIAENQNKMLLIYFCDSCGKGKCNQFKAETLNDAQVRRKLNDYVCVQLPMDATITVDGKDVKLLDHDAYREMLGDPGIAIVDYRSSDAALRGKVVSVFPITESLSYTPERMLVILDLPPGTLTQRTLIYAVRIHPEKPASADSELDANLIAEAESHAEYQARVHVQGHQFWETRFHRIVSRLPGGLSAREVCAESWPGQHLVEAAIECVRCWRLSDGHWSAVRSRNRFFAYDMKRGSNGIWYATGIFGAR